MLVHNADMTLLVATFFLLQKTNVEGLFILPREAL
jgi:hypothetical protein